MYVALAYAHLSASAGDKRERDLPRINVFHDSLQNLFVAFSVLDPPGSSVGVKESIEGRLI